MLLNSFLTLCCLGVTSNMVAAITLNAPTTDVNMTAFLESVETDEAGGKHLWFNYVWAIGSGNSYSRCGEVDAAQRMPAELFQLKNIGKLAQYASLTTQLYTVTGMNPGTKLQLGRCSSRGYTQKQSAMDGVGWAPSELMGPICLKQCDCTSTSAGRYNDDDPPYCEDAPDDPKSGKFCSLCGPKYNSYIKIQLYNKGNDQEKTSSTDNAVEDKSKHKNKNKNKKDNEDGTMNQAADSASTVQSGLVLATVCLMAALAMVV